jgi:hypothetical protein
MFKGAIFTLVCLLSSNCLACDKTIEELVKKNFGDNYSYLTCKQNPSVKTQTIVAFAGNPATDENQSTVNDAIVLLVSNNKITNQIVEKSMLYSDAIYLSDIKIDTAAYTISKNIRAFGVRFIFNGSSRVSPSTDEFMNLYITDNKNIKNILRGLTTYNFSGDWDGTSCEGVFDETNFYLSISPVQTNGFANILLTKKSQHKKSIKINNECEEKILYSPTEKQKIIFNGDRYILKKSLTSSYIN